MGAVLRILLDANLPGAEQLLAPVAEIRTFRQREPAATDLAWADVLWVRSVTRVDAALLARAPALQFVGTATIGTEHIDLDALRHRNIAFASAPGSNAISVGQYVATACVALQSARAGQQALIIGAGHTGQAAGRMLTALGMQVRYYDPPRQRAGDKTLPWAPWSAVAGADVVSCHVPLNRTGQDATWHLFDEQRIASLPAGSTLINASRGAVVDNRALWQRLRRHRDLRVVLDVWEGEPGVIPELVGLVNIATPHIAGHSHEGKRRGVAMLYQSLQQHFPWQLPVLPDAALQLPPEPGMLRADDASPTALAKAMLAVYPIWRDDAMMRESGLTAAGFDQLRRQYPGRREFSAWSLQAPTALQQAAGQLGFRLTA